MNSSSTLPPLPMLLQLDLEATTVLEANRPQKPLKNCWASEAPQGALLHLAHWVGQWQHHNLHPFPHPCNQSQARTLHPSRALEAPVVEGFFWLVAGSLELLWCGNPPLHARFCHTACMRACHAGTSVSGIRTSDGPHTREETGNFDKTWIALAAFCCQCKRETQQMPKTQSQNDCESTPCIILTQQEDWRTCPKNINSPEACCMSAPIRIEEPSNPKHDMSRILYTLPQDGL